MTYETEKNGVLIEAEMSMLVGGFPACEGGNSAHDRATHKWVPEIIAKAQHQADIEKVRATNEGIEEYLRLHTREGDCPCAEHQAQIKEMARDIVRVILKALGEKDEAQKG